jgi:ParB-like chromosome segregation protein Spo0J
MSENEFGDFDILDEDSPNRWQIRKVKLADVQPMPENPRTISDRALAGLEASLTRFGYVEPIVWNENTGHIVGGHRRFSILKGQGVEEATMVVVSLSPEEEMGANLTLNNPKIEGTWDESALPLIAQMEAADDKLFRALNMDTLKESLEKPSSLKGDDAPPSGINVGDEGEDGKKEEELDTACPCCGHRWNIGAGDVSVEELSAKD